MKTIMFSQSLSRLLSISWGLHPVLPPGLAEGPWVGSPSPAALLRHRGVAVPVWWQRQGGWAGPALCQVWVLLQGSTCCPGYREGAGE